jgi:aryl-alcohol dehydrogenase-like predicted oxidoreductase
VSEIGLGLAALGRPGYINLGHGEDLGNERSVDALERRTHEVLDAAWAAGVRYYDAARSYGRAEDFLGSWLRTREIDPGSVVVASKWGYRYTARWQVDADPPEVKDLSVGQLLRQLGETRALLGEWLSLYQIHSATLSSGVLEDEAVLAELAEMRRSGLDVGLSVSGDEQPETVERAVELGAFDAVQATYNLLERSAGPALERAHAAGMRVVVKEALANGRLTARGKIDPLGAVAVRLGMTADAVAIATLLARPWVDVVLSGAATVDQLRSNLRALEIDWTSELEGELGGLEEPSDAYWSRRSELAWT